MTFEKYLEYLKYIMDRFHPIGSNEEGGVTRLGYSKEEDLMHWEFMRIAKEEGFQVETDQVGNSYASLGKYDEYHLVGSHLDSVINGGRYDGVIGVAVGLLLLKIVKEKALDIPLKVVAFRCEESSNFMKSTIGSGLIVGENYEKEFDTLVSRSGEGLREIFAKRG
ncbi:MAG TPA: M28 family peptidase [Tissierellaceae bacterium]|nr:M28 family peptidase [Tissierellaceae bacterium]